MIRSMTGYGQALIRTGEYEITVEMKSVNHRFCEISVRIPREFLFLEDLVKRKTAEQIKRGKIDIFITIERKRGGSSKKLRVDWELASEYVQVYAALSEKFCLQSRELSPLDLLHLPEVVQLEQDEQDASALADAVLEAVVNACHQLIHMRESEGRVLQEDITLRIKEIEKQVEAIWARAPIVVEFYRERLNQRIQDFLAGNWSVDEARLLNEVAVFADKANIDEELTRISSHCQQFRYALQSNEAVGRKMDFMIQEMNREVNTIGSKANDIEISQRVVVLKAELEKIKEQVQNIE